MAPRPTEPAASSSAAQTNPKPLTYERLLASLEKNHDAITTQLAYGEDIERLTEILNVIQEAIDIANDALHGGEVTSPGKLKHEVKDKIDAINAKFDQTEQTDHEPVAVQKKTTKPGTGGKKKGKEKIGVAVGESTTESAAGGNEHMTQVSKGVDQNTYNAAVALQKLSSSGKENTLKISAVKKTIIKPNSNAKKTIGKHDARGKLPQPVVNIQDNNAVIDTIGEPSGSAPIPPPDESSNSNAEIHAQAIDDYLSSTTPMDDSNYLKFLKSHKEITLSNFTRKYDAVIAELEATAHEFYNDRVQEMHHLDQVSKRFIMERHKQGLKLNLKKGSRGVRLQNKVNANDNALRSEVSSSPYESKGKKRAADDRPTESPASPAKRTKYADFLEVPEIAEGKSAEQVFFQGVEYAVQNCMIQYATMPTIIESLFSPTGTFENYVMHKLGLEYENGEAVHVVLSGEEADDELGDTSLETVESAGTGAGGTE